MDVESYTTRKLIRDMFGNGCNYQGNSYRKAMLNFHKSTPIEVTPEDISAFI